MTQAEEALTSRQRQRQQTRSHILAAAADAFARAGFEAASLADIAASADVKKALVQYHFSTKEQLWRETALHIWQLRNDAIATRMASCGDSELPRKMREGFTALLEFTREKPQWLWFMFHEAAAQGERQRWLIEHCLAEDYRLGEIFVVEFQKQGLIRAGSPLHLLHLISGALTYNLLVAPSTRLTTGVDLASPAAIAEQVDLLLELLRP
ncbi:TetR family transcriptional regulator [Halioglobus maricola]|uniref:TetR family transcriptional regulator n=1 Tax=Halioglobus maricola TaxID=2601894 RepID=A0A5P9NKM9_9GAMM|nr:TetR/AcrR family transcriptional regulator [Halioglobus maricola]QFU76423.1 TetR family transcriptional regulator [Halioglobus maricola]